MFMIFVETGPDDQTDVDNEFFTAALKEMVSLGIDITRIIHQQVVAQSIDSPHNPIPEATSLAFERVSRAVRRSIMLAKKLRDPKPSPSPALAGATRGEGGARKRETNAQKDQDPRDRPDSPDRLETLEDRPILELINEIRKDLNLPPLPPPGNVRDEAPADRSEAALQSPPGPTIEEGAQHPTALHPSKPQNGPQTHGPPGS